jgi:ribosomal protein L11 methyltransferase
MAEISGKLVQPSEPAGWYYRLGPGLLLTDRQQAPRPRIAEKLMVVKSGRAFPLGHPTTRLCLDLLTGTLADRPAASLVEIGCGTGILCLAAGALGVTRVTGLDIAAAAVQTTRRNARDNALAAAIQVIRGSSDCLRARFDLVVANLPWEIQLDQAAQLHRLAARGGRVLLSGFRDNQEEQLLAHYRSLGWTLSRRLATCFTHPELPPHISFNWAAWLLEHGDD